MKTLITITYFGIAMLCFVGCSKKSGTSPVTKNSIEGKWTEDSVTIITYKDAKITNNYKETTPDGTYWQFNANGKAVDHWPPFQSYAAVDVQLTYIISGSTLTLNYPAFQAQGTAYDAWTDVWTVLTLNEHTLAIRYSDNGSDISNNAIVQYFYYSR
jgi:hypothetical protein